MTKFRAACVQMRSSDDMQANIADASALIRDAVARGIAADVARRAAVGILIGTGRLFEKTGEDPADTVAAFVDYRGVTAAAILAMRAAGFDTVVAAGLAAALEKSATLPPAKETP